MDEIPERWREKKTEPPKDGKRKPATAKKDKDTSTDGKSEIYVKKPDDAAKKGKEDVTRKKAVDDAAKAKKAAEAKRQEDLANYRTKPLFMLAQAGLKFVNDRPNLVRLARLSISSQLLPNNGRSVGGDLQSGHDEVRNRGCSHHP